MERFIKIGENLYGNYEVICGCTVANKKISLEQSLIVQMPEKFWSFSIFIKTSNGDWECPSIWYNRADAWKAFKKAVINEMFPL